MANPLHTIMRALLQKNGNVWEIYLIQHWKSIVGNLHTRMCLEKIQDDTVVIGVYDAHWMQELHLLQNMLITMINAPFDKPYVKHIRLKLAKNITKTKKNKQTQAEDLRPPVVVTPQHEKALAHVKDAQLQEVLYQFLQHCKK